MTHRLIAYSMCLLLLCATQASAGLSQFLGQDEAQDFLPVEKAFQAEAAVIDAQQAQVHFRVTPGHYLYRERIQVTVPTGKAGTIVSVDLPAGEEKNDPSFGKQQVFHHDTLATVQLGMPAPTQLQVRYQGCSEKGLCYPPQTKLLALELPLRDQAAIPAVASAPVVTPDEGDGIARLLRQGHWWQIVGGFFVAGLLLSLTPCVFPMIPILSGIIVGKNAHVSRAKAFTLSLAYTLGMCLTYTLAGVAAGLSGQLLSSALQTPPALIAGALIFVLLSLSMFGFYELKLPSVVENAFFNWSNRFKGGHLFSDFLMGAISALIISPCVAAPLAGALLYISQTHDVTLGAVALFSLSFGMGVPLLLIGASAGTLLPKAGAWMNAVRQLFGVLMLAVAVWIVNPLLPVSLQLVCWASLCIFPAMYLWSVSQRQQWLQKGLALMLLLYGVALLIGAWSGTRSVLQPLQGVFAQGSATTTSHTAFQRVRSQTELQAALDAASGQPVMLDFYADWCVSCKEYEQFVFSDPKVAAKLANLHLLQVDVTANNDDDKALLKQFALFGPPGIVFFDSHGQLQQVVKGYQDAAQFLNTLEQLQAGAPHV